MDDCSARRGPPTAAVECVRRLFRRCLQHRRVHCPRGSTRCLFCLPQRRSMRPAAKNDPRIREIRVIRLESADNLNSPVGWMEHGSQRAQPAGSLPGLTLPSTNWLSPFRAIVSASEITTPRCWSSNWPFFSPLFFSFVSPAKRDSRHTRRWKNFTENFAVCGNFIRSSRHRRVISSDWIIPCRCFASGIIEPIIADETSEEWKSGYFFLNWHERVCVKGFWPPPPVPLRAIFKRSRYVFSVFFFFFFFF